MVDAQKLPIGRIAELYGVSRTTIYKVAPRRENEAGEAQPVKRKPMIRTILQQYRDESAFNRDLGDRFERLIRAYLKLDPQYVALFSDVWLWKDWPEREAYGYKAPDTGIDLVAKLREDEGFTAPSSASSTTRRSPWATLATSSPCRARAASPSA
jgi:hypothetical protein